MSLILNINGYPGVGKLTIGTIVAERLQARLLDNHTIYNPAFALTEFKSEAHLRLTRAVRDLCYEQVLALPIETAIVMTNTLMGDSDWGKENWELIIDLAARRGVPLLNVVLTCELDENKRRIQGETRFAKRKPRNPEFTRSNEIGRPVLNHGGTSLLRLDVSRLEPDAAAERIVAWARPSEDGRGPGAL